MPWRASAGYLTVSEIFPIEIRAEALAVFFAIAQIVGAVGPAFYGVLIGDGSSRTGLAIGYVVGGGIMIIGGLVEIVFGIDAEGKPLEDPGPAHRGRRLITPRLAERGMLGGPGPGSMVSAGA